MTIHRCVIRLMTDRTGTGREHFYCIVGLGGTSIFAAVFAETASGATFIEAELSLYLKIRLGGGGGIGKIGKGKVRYTPIGSQVIFIILVQNLLPSFCALYKAPFQVGHRTPVFCALKQTQKGSSSISSDPRPYVSYICVQ